MKPLIEYIGKPALLEQTAEECIELAFACLKLARYMRGENKVPGRSETELLYSLHREFADVQIVLDQLTAGKVVDQREVSMWRLFKGNRMKHRFEEDDNDNKDI